MSDSQIKKIVMVSLFTALTCVATMVIRIPSPTGGYINPGDAVVLLGSFLLGPIWGAVAAALGSAMADVFSGYAVYAPATFIIKGLMALCGGIILNKLKSKKAAGAILGSFVAEIIMVVGYLLFTATILGYGLGAVAEVPGNLVQGVFGIIAGTALYVALSKIPYISQVSESVKAKKTPSINGEAIAKTNARR